MEDFNTNFTMFVNTDNIKDIETLDEYIILAQKPCLYANGKYSIIEFSVLDESPECYDPETMLEVMGGLVVHEDGSNCFMALERDLAEVSKIFCWDNAASILMGEMLTGGDRLLLLEKKQIKEGLTGDIQINVSSREKPEWKTVTKAIKDVFEDNGSIYKFGETENTVDIWWPFLLEEVGGFHFVVQSDEDEDIPVYPLANPYQPNPWNPDDDDFFSEYEDYNWTHMNHAGGRYQF